MNIYVSIFIYLNLSDHGSYIIRILLYKPVIMAIDQKHIFTYFISTYMGNEYFKSSIFHIVIYLKLNENFFILV